MKKRFKKIYIEITNVCNLSCHFCPPTRRVKKFMGVDEFKKVLEQIRMYTDYVYLHLRGEPLVHPQLEEILDICSDYNIKVNITTNATLLDKNSDILQKAKAIRQINYSLHSLEENNINLFKEYLDTIIKFTEDNPQIIHSLRFWNLEAGVEKNIEISEYLKTKLLLTQDDILKMNIKIKENLYLNQETEFTWPTLNNSYHEVKGFCYGLRDQVGILANGDIVPCCLDAEGVITLGNIFIDSFKEVINSPRAMAIYNGFSNRTAVEDLCIHCEYKNRFQ